MNLNLKLLPLKKYICEETRNSTTQPNLT